MQSGSIGSAAALQAMKMFMGKSGQQGGGSSNNFVSRIIIASVANDHL